MTEQSPTPPGDPVSQSAHVRVEQTTETSLTTHVTPFGTALYLYNRSHDSIDAEVTGQDYLAYRYNANNLAFAVCDGVGQSFMGDLAARLLGDGLVEWLFALDERPADEETFQQTVTAALDEMTVDGAQAVADYKLPAHLPPILVQALEMQRKYGSESMFVAGRLALDAEQPWVALCWLGDSPVAAVDIDGELVDLGPRGSTAERWNASTGVKGEVHTWLGDANHVARVAGYTDGLGVEVEDVPTDADLARLMKVWASDPPADDATLFDVRLAPSPATTGQNEPPAPDTVKVPEFKPIRVEKDEAERSPVSRVEPIEEQEEATPVSHVEPIEKAGPGSAVGEWRPIGGEPAGETADGESDDTPPVPAPPDDAPVAAPDLKTAAEMLQKAAQGAATPTELGEPTIRQIQMWQQAALLNLTSAALAMLMVDRLMRDEDDENTEANN